MEKILYLRSDKTVLRRDDKIVKIFSGSYSKADVLNEALNQARAEETNLNVPTVYEVTKADGKWAIVSQYIEGKTLRAMMEENPEKREEYLDYFIGLQMAIHAEKCPLLIRMRDKLRRKIADAEDIEATTRYDLIDRLERMPTHYKVCHGDFNPSNVIITAEGKPYIVDWVYATQGCASADVAYSYLLFCQSDGDAFAERYLDRYAEKSGTDKSYIKRWIPIVACANLTQNRAIDRKMFAVWAHVNE